jgi:beta-galactosidase GanA
MFDTAPTLDCNGRLLRLDRPRVMGIVNATPDSFSGVGACDTVDATVAHALQLVREGADILDIGGESTRPGAAEVDVEEELRRVLPVIERLVAETGVERLPGASDLVEVTRRVGDDASWLFVINHGDEQAEVPVRGVELVTGRDVAGDLLVPAGGVAVVREAFEGRGGVKHGCAR